MTRENVVRSTRMPDQPFDFLVSTGHDEYGPAKVPGLTVIEAWSPLYDDDELIEDESRLIEQFKAGNDGLLPPDADLTWENIVRWQGDRAAVEAGLESLIEHVDSTPGGDDDTFDYWPSGVRYAMAVAGQLGDEWPSKVATIATRIITEDKALFGTELFDKIGLEPPEGWQDAS